MQLDAMVANSRRNRKAWAAFRIYGYARYDKRPARMGSSLGLSGPAAGKKNTRSAVVRNELRYATERKKEREGKRQREREREILLFVAKKTSTPTNFEARRFL